jgi:hypothetical protein
VLTFLRIKGYDIKFKNLACFAESSADDDENGLKANGHKDRLQELTEYSWIIDFFIAIIIYKEIMR